MTSYRRKLFRRDGNGETTICGAIRTRWLWLELRLGYGKVGVVVRVWLGLSLDMVRVVVRHGWGCCKGMVGVAVWVW